jgi:hypothetical protein
MSGRSVAPPPDPSWDPASNLVRRRTVLTAGLVITGGLAFGVPACTTPARQDEGVGLPFLDVSVDAVRQGPNLLRLQLDSDNNVRPVAQRLVLGTSRNENVDLEVTSMRNRVGLGLSQEEAGQSQSGRVTVTVSRTQKAVVWVFPRETGPALEAADRITVASKYGPAVIEVWIEPTGGKWEALIGPDGKKLDLGIVPMNAAVMRKNGTNQAEVIMYSPPRLRNNQGKLVVNQGESVKERWYWPVKVLDGDDLNALAKEVSDGTGNVLAFDGTESSVLDLKPPNAEKPWELAAPTAVSGLYINLFCGGQAHQADGQLLAVGGHLDVEYAGKDAEKPNPGPSNRNGTDRVDRNDRNGKALHTYSSDQKWRQSTRSLPGEPGKDRRWYPTVTALPDGRMLITGGASDCYYNSRFWNKINETYVVYEPTSGGSIGPLRLTPEHADQLIGWGDIKGEWISSSNPLKYGPERGCSIANGAIGGECEKATSRIIAGKLSTYPGVFVLPRADGGTVIAVVESNRTWLYDYVPTDQAGPLKLLPPHQSQLLYYPMKTQGTRTYPWYGSMVLLPLKPGDNNQKVRILVAGGQNENDASRLPYRYREWLEGHTSARARPPASAKTAEIFEFDPGEQGQSGWQKEYKAMHQGRILCDATLLADGRVLISGGSEEGFTNNNSPRDAKSEGFKVDGTPGSPVYDSELFDPEEQVFKKAARARTDRRYHSVALLLPDGTVLKAGSTGGFDADFYYPPYPPEQLKDKLKDIKHGWFRSHTDAERYFPPYLFRGPRPQIEPATGNTIRTLHSGQEFTVVAHGPSMASDAKIALIRLGAVTHGIDMDQRYIWLEVRRQQPTNNNSRSITAAPPMNTAFAPPGDYYLVVVDSIGVPSEGEIVTVGA